MPGGTQKQPVTFRAGFQACGFGLLGSSPPAGLRGPGGWHRHGGMSDVTPLQSARSRTVGATTLVDASADAVFALLTDPRRHHEVDGSSTVGTEVIGPRELMLGDKFRVSMKLKGIPYAMTSTVTDLIPGHVIEWQLPAGHKWRWEITPENGRTRVTEIFDWSGAKIPWLIEKIQAPARNAQSIEQSLRRLGLLRLG